MSGVVCVGLQDLEEGVVGGALQETLARHLHRLGTRTLELDDVQRQVTATDRAERCGELMVAQGGGRCGVGGRARRGGWLVRGARREGQAEGNSPELVEVAVGVPARVQPQLQPALLHGVKGHYLRLHCPRCQRVSQLHELR